MMGNGYVLLLFSSAEHSEVQSMVSAGRDAGWAQSHGFPPIREQGSVGGTPRDLAVLVGQRAAFQVTWMPRQMSVLVKAGLRGAQRGYPPEQAGGHRLRSSPAGKKNSVLVLKCVMGRKSPGCF